MSTEAELASAREQYRDHVLAYWHAIKQGNSEQANAHSAQADGIVTSHEADFSALLRPLTEDPSAEVRCAAAGALLQRGDTTAVSVLEQIENDTTAGLVASSAELILRSWRKRNAST